MSPQSVSPQPMPAQPRYTGPPSYPTPPRWGFPRLGWRWSVPLTAGQVRAAEVSNGGRMRALAATAVPLLGLSALLVLVTAVAEAWRYALLLDSRTDAVAAAPLHASDVLVVTGGVISLLASILAGAVTVGWLVRASAVAAHSGGTTARPTWQLVAGVLVPGLNLLMPGVLLAELEHAALGRDPGHRPRPSRLVVGWWAAWTSGLVLAGIAVLWNLRTGVQARADGVLLHVATDLMAGIVAIITIIVVRRLTRLLSPVQRDSVRRLVRLGRS